MNKQQKKFIVDAINSEDEKYLKHLDSTFKTLFDDNVQKLIKVFQLDERESLRLLPFDESTIELYCEKLATLTEDIDAKQGAIVYLCFELQKIEAKPFWPIWYKLSEFKKYPTTFKSKAFKANKEAIRALFKPKQVEAQVSSLAGAKLLNRCDDDVVKLVRLAFKNRKTPDNWADEDEEFRKDFHYKYKDYANYNEKNLCPKRNQRAWETSGMNVFRSDLGFWMNFDDVPDEAIKKALMYYAKTYCQMSIDVLEPKANDKHMGDIYSNGIKILKNNIEKIEKMLSLE